MEVGLTELFASKTRDWYRRGIINHAERWLKTLESDGHYFEEWFNLLSQRSLMDTQPHPLLHFLVRMKPTSTNVFLQVAKYVEVTRGKIWIVRRMLKCFPAKSLKIIPHHIGSMGTGVIMQKDDCVRQHSREFLLHGTSQHPQSPRNEPHLSALLCLPPFPILENILYTMLTSRAIKNNCVNLCVFTMHVSYPTDGITKVLPLLRGMCFM